MSILLLVSAILLVLAFTQQQFCETSDNDCIVALESDEREGHIQLIQQRAMKMGKSATATHADAASSQKEKYTTSTTSTSVGAVVCEYADEPAYAVYTYPFASPGISDNAAHALCKPYSRNWNEQMAGFDLGNNSFLPIYTSKDLTVKNEKVERVTMWIHGAKLNAEWFYCVGRGAADLHGNSETSLVISPLFPDHIYRGSGWSSSLDSSQESPCWQDASYATGLDWGYANTEINLLWNLGGNSAPLPDGKTISALQILDKLIGAFLPKDTSSASPILLGKGRYVDNFPNIKKVQLVGFSAGGHICHFWSFFSPLASLASVEIILGDLNHYLYLDDKRPGLECRKLQDTGKNSSCRDYSVPTQDACDVYATSKNTINGWGFPDIDSPAYNGFPFGLSISNPAWFSGLGAYFEYVGGILSDRALVEELIYYFPSKNVYQVQGDRDVCNCGIKDYRNLQDETCYPTHNPPALPPDTAKTYCDGNFEGGEFNGFGCCDTWPDSFTGPSSSGTNVATGGCATMLMGANRLQRASNYANYLDIFYGLREDLPDMNYKIMFFNGTHDSIAFSQSPALQKLLFGSGLKAPTSTSSSFPG
mmetsp:Transcript_116667/g.184571  ORF Transcript_116667/g.184571 Transcript_116667/m.184571 type:complete len:592 (-) Transcript_116667:248-2023(-)